MEQVLAWLSPFLIICTMLAAFAENAIAKRGPVESRLAVASFWVSLERFDVREVLRVVARVADGTLSLWFGPKLLSLGTLVRWTLFSIVASMIVSTTFLLTYEGGLLEPLTHEHHLKVALSTLLAIVTVDFACLTLHRWMFRHTTGTVRFLLFAVCSLAATYVAVSCCNIIFYFQWLDASWESLRTYFLWPATMATRGSQIVLFMPAFLALLLFATCCVIVLVLALTTFVSKALATALVGGLAKAPAGILTIGTGILTILAALVATVHAAFITN